MGTQQHTRKQSEPAPALQERTRNESSLICSQYCCLTLKANKCFFPPKMLNYSFLKYFKNNNNNIIHLLPLLNHGMLFYVTSALGSLQDERIICPQADGTFRASTNSKMISVLNKVGKKVSQTTSFSVNAYLPDRTSSRFLNTTDWS